jgi:muramoyltetrapeptide carboxypeptidase
MRYPDQLKKGDTVGLICSSSPVSEERAQQCIALLESLGYQVKAAENLAVNYGGYMAGEGAIRGAAINRMFADPDVKAIFCVRGGDGGSRVMEHIDLPLIKRNPKIFVGYSDVTSLHIAINQACGLVTFHGPMVSSNMVDRFDAETSESFFSAINAEKDFEFKNPAGHELQALKEGCSEGVLVGGNLAVISAGIGTYYEIDTKDKILFIEDVDEGVYRIERFAYQLRNAGKLKAAKGILLGQFSNCENKDMPEYDVIRCLQDILDGLDIPVMHNVQSGHGSPMMTLPFGAVCRIDTGSKAISFKIER